MQNGARDVLHPFHQLDQHVVIVRTHGRKTNAAVPHHYRRHAVVTRRMQTIGPGNLAIVVRVNVNESWCDDGAIRSNLLLALASHLAHLNDGATAHRHIRGTAIGATAVDHFTATHDQIEFSHYQSPTPRASRRTALPLHRHPCSKA